MWTEQTKMTVSQIVYLPLSTMNLAIKILFNKTTLKVFFKARGHLLHGGGYRQYLLQEAYRSTACVRIRYS